MAPLNVKIDEDIASPEKTYFSHNRATFIVHVIMCAYESFQTNCTMINVQIKSYFMVHCEVYVITKCFTVWAFNSR